MICQAEPGKFCPIFSKNAENLKMAVKNFPQTFGRYIGAHFFYFSTQIIDQLRKKPFRKVVTELRFLTQLFVLLFILSSRSNTANFPSTSSSLVNVMCSGSTLLR